MLQNVAAAAFFFSPISNFPNNAPRNSTAVEWFQMAAKGQALEAVALPFTHRFDVSTFFNSSNIHLK